MSTDASQCSEPILPMSHQLDVKEKAKQQKKVRIMTKFFGEVHVLESSALEADKSGVGSLEPGLSPRWRPSSQSGLASRGRLSPWRKVAQSPSISAMTEVISHNMQRGNEPLFVSQTDQLLPPQTRPSSAPDSLSASNTLLSIYPSSITSSIDNDGQSLTSLVSVTSIGLSPDQLRMAKIDKLSHHLGENIPHELVSPPVSVFAAHSLLTRRKKKRNTNLNLTHFTQPPLSPATANGTFGGKDENTSLQRSQSLQTPKTRHPDSPEASWGCFQQRHHRNFGTQEQMNEKRRTSNVKRARKMAQVFGCEPPPELIQVLDDQQVLSSKDTNRDSIATPLSLSSTYLSSDTPPTPRRSYSSSSSVFEEVLAQPEDMELENDVTHEILSTPPLFSTIQADGSLDSPPFRHLSSATSTFGERRRRAAKLTRFFGVGYQDFSPSMNPELVSSSAPAEPCTAGVYVKVNSRGRFWGFSNGQAHLKDADMVDVEGKLRALKAA